MMMTAPPGTTGQKRDLHVGGVGSRTGGALAAITHLDPADAGNEFGMRARATLDDATRAVRGKPWSALAVVGVVGLAAGYLLGRREE